MKPANYQDILQREIFRLFTYKAPERGIQPSDFVSIGPNGDFIVKSPMIQTVVPPAVPWQQCTVEGAKEFIPKFGNLNSFEQIVRKNLMKFAELIVCLQKPHPSQKKWKICRAMILKLLFLLLTM